MFSLKRDSCEIKTAWDIEGMLSPCCEAVVDISAPVAQKRMFFSVPFFTLSRKYPQSTDAEQPQPEPPA